jgi:polyferredoxin/Pyruvate/2-oxoacid:ferredoxin oxidoreductase delta subunit
MAVQKIKKHRIIRWFIQLFFLGLFVFFFIQTRYGVSVSAQNIFFRFDPLIFIVTSIAYRAVITGTLLSIIILAGTLLFGRFFCGFICPLGTIIDIADASIGRKIEHTRSLKNIKYMILLFLIVSALIGSSFLHFFDPLVITERSLTLIFYPIVTYILGLVFPLKHAVYTETIIATLVFVGILALGVIAPRFWCRNLCPLGGLLALLSKFSFFKFTFGTGCTQCGICEEICPTGAIHAGKEKIDSAECIDCLRCQYECPHYAITYRKNLSMVPLDITRRQVIASIGASIIAAPLVRSFLHQRLGGRLIRPPGSIPEEDFLNLCIHCGKCMKVCPTNGLQPCVLEAGINGMWTPRLAPRIGGCEKNCNMCGQVCPTSAIRALPLEEKTYVKIGTAVIDRARCIAWEQDKVCLICDEACPYNAISSLSETIRETTLLRPFVDERICTGCGLCETQCPIEGESAIQVFSIGEERKRTGSYITEEKVQLRACEEKVEDLPSGFILDND